MRKIFLIAFFTLFLANVNAQQFTNAGIQQLTNIQYIKFWGDSITVFFDTIKYDTVRIDNTISSMMQIDIFQNGRWFSEQFPSDKKTVKDFQKEGVKDTVRDPLKHFFLNDDSAAPRYSEKKVYTVEGKEYTIYHYEVYNCNDPLCGQKHGHMRMKISDVYFNPQYGIIARVDSRSHYQLLSSVKEIYFPPQLILAFLKSQNANKKVHDIYIKETINVGSSLSD